MANNASPEPIPLILTRPRLASEFFFASLPESLRVLFTPVFSPLIEIVNLDVTVQMALEDAAIFTSANGVLAAPNGQGRRAYCVGPATTKAAKSCGWSPEQAGTDAKSLLAALKDKRPMQRLFHLSGQHARGDVAAQLTQAGLNVERVVLYDQRLCDLTEMAINTLRREERIIVPLFSPRTAAQFVAVAPQTASVHVVALSRDVANALGTAQLASLAVAARPDAQAMSTALNELTKKT
ncbi:uroporphyrinogen-III synthase [Tateyamaria sp.]|uniref:uroporphyrinogen-III synthase n=1 Tax=Tateyamaria sp. TaxID=1929288 RepID=UPI00329AE5D0